MKNLLSFIAENLKPLHTYFLEWYSTLTLEKAVFTVIASLVTIIAFILAPPQPVQDFYTWYFTLTIVDPYWLTISLTAGLIALHLHLKKRGPQENEKKETSTFSPSPLPIDLPTLEAKLLPRIPDILPIDHLVMTHLEHLKTAPTLLETDKSSIVLCNRTFPSRILSKAI